MLTPKFPRAGNVKLNITQAGESPPLRRFSRSTVVLLGGACALAVVLSGGLLLGFSAPDPIQTATVPPKVEETANADGPPPVAAQVDAKAVKQDRQPTSTAARREPLAANDMRFGETNPSTENADAGHLQPVAEAPHEPDVAPSSAQLAAADGVQDAPQDAAAPASMEADEAAVVQVAESEAEVAKLEASTGMMDETTIPSKAKSPDKKPGSTAKSAQPALAAAHVTKYVNLRDGPADEAKVIVVVPANAAIEAQTNCGWCAVNYNGQQGYIYKSFIRRSTAEEASAGQGLF